MKRNLRNLFVAFVAMIVPIAVWAQESSDEAKWGASKDALTGSGTLSDAISAAAYGSVGYIQLQRDVTTDGKNNIEGGEFALDLNGYTLSSNDHTLYIQNTGTKVTITDNSEGKRGKVVGIGEGCSAVTASSGANVTIEAGSYESDQYTVYIEGASSSATISGGTFTSSGYSTIENSGTLTISGGTFTSSGSETIYNNGTLTISGGNFTSGTQCVVWSYGESQTSITGGSFTTTEDAWGTIVYYGGKLDLSAYPTTETEGTTAITDLSVHNSVRNLAVSGSTIALPAGYCFYDSENQAVGTLQNGKKYTIGTEPETKYTIIFNVNGGSGSMAEAYSYDGNYLLPECTFTAPEDKFFVAWQVGENEYQPGKSITITADVAIKAVWGGPEAKWGASQSELTQSGTFSAAINEAQEDGSVKYIQLQRDVTTEGGNYIERGEFTLDLNGYTLSSNDYTLCIKNTGTKVTITDSSEGKSGKVVSTSESCIAVTASSGANVTIEAGSYESVLSTVYIEDDISSATISGGTFTSSGQNVFHNNGTLTISGGNFTSGTQCVVWLYDESQTSITGGSFTTTEGAWGTIVYDSGKLDLSAYPTTETEGTTAITDLSVYNNVENLAVSASTIALPAGYCFYDSENQAVGTLQYREKYTIGTEAKWGASQSELTQSGTLSDAISAAQEDGSTVVYIQLQRDVTNEFGNNIEGGEFTLDLNGYTLSSNGYTLYFLKTGTQVTITDNSEGKSGKVVGTSEFCSAVTASSGANVTIEAGSYESVQYTVYIEGASSSATISGGTFTSSGSETIHNNGTLTISGGNFTSGTQCVVWLYDESQTSITGGTFTTTEGAWGTIVYQSGKLDLSAYPTTETEGTTAITDISVYNRVGNLAVSGSTIALPAGYCFYEDESNAVVTLQYENKYTIGTEPETKYTITFDENGGSGTMADAYSYGGKLILPKCTFTAPEGKMFKAWLIDGSEYVSGCPITPTSNITAQAVWSDYIPQLVIRMHDTLGDGWNSAEIEIQKGGKVIGEATIANGYEGSAVFDYDPIDEYTFYWTMGDYSNECSFEILLGNDIIYSATTEDCAELAEGLFHTVEKSEDYELTVSSAGYATLCLPYNAVVPEGLTAYIATDAGEYVQLSKIESGMIAANEGVVIKGEPGTYTFEETAEEVTPSNENQMHGVTTKTYLTANDNAYMLTTDKENRVLAFRLLATDYTIAPYKAFLVLSEYGARTLINIMWDDNATGIETVNGSAQDSVIYNLSGQKLTRAQKGINIVNGKLEIK